MGNVSSELMSHLYVLRMTNDDLPLIPFLHTIVSYNNKPIDKTDPRTFKSILATANLILEIRDVRNSSHFKIEVPRGTEKLGINVIRMQSNVRPLHIKVTNVREGCPFALEDHILGIENVYIDNENEFVRYVKNNQNKEVVFIVARRGTVIRVPVTLTAELGCEISTGLLHKLGSEEELYMEGYNGKIKRERVDSQCEDRQQEVNDIEAKNDAEVTEQKGLPSASHEEKEIGAGLCTGPISESAVTGEEKQSIDNSLHEGQDTIQSAAEENINDGGSNRQYIESKATDDASSSASFWAKEEQADMFEISRYEAGSYGAHFFDPAVSGVMSASNELNTSDALVNEFQKLSTSSSEIKDAVESSTQVYAEEQYQSPEKYGANDLSQGQYGGMGESVYYNDGDREMTFQDNGAQDIVQEPARLNPKVSEAIAGCNDYLRGQQSLDSPAAVMLENEVVPGSSLVRNEVGMQVAREIFDEMGHHGINRTGHAFAERSAHATSQGLSEEFSFGEEKGPFGGISSSQLSFSDEYNDQENTAEQGIRFDEPEHVVENFSDAIENGGIAESELAGEDLCAYLFSQEGNREKDNTGSTQSAVIDFEEGDDFVFECKEHY